MGWGSFCGSTSKASKKYQRDVLRSTGGYVLVLLGSSYIVRHMHPRGWELYFFAVLPAVPLIITLVHLGIYLRDETDEYVRVLTVRSLLVGTGALLATLVVNDFLRAFTTTGALPPFVSFFIFFVAFGVAQAVQARLNRAGGDEEQA